jgi:DNA-binding GntR family transcriptional regulator
MEIIDPVARRVDVDLAGRLRLSSDQIVAGSFRRTYDGETFCLTRFALPPDLGQRLLRARQLPQPGQSGHITIIGLLENRLGVPIAAAHQSATASAASGAIATELGLTSGQPVLRIDRLYFDATGRPVEIAVSHFNPRLYTYRLELRRAMTHAPAMDA